MRRLTPDRDHRLVLTSVVLSLVAAGCTIAPKQLTKAELVDTADKDSAVMFADPSEYSGRLSLDRAIALALKYNLDHRVKLFEETLAYDQTKVDRFDLLPKLTANAGWNWRSNKPASSSEDYDDGSTSVTNRSFSQERRRHLRDLTLSWNILDFGVSYYNAKQNGEKTSIAHEARRKLRQNIIVDVRNAYWRAVGNDALRHRIRATIRRARRALANSNAVARERLISPLRALRYRKTLLENLRQLTMAEQDLATSKVELAGLLSIKPGTKYRLRRSRLRVPGWSASTAVAEEISFQRNADLRSRHHSVKVSVFETRKALWKLVPGISLVASTQHDSNKYLVHPNWEEASVRIGANLVQSILAAPSIRAYNEDNEKLNIARRVAVRMAVLAQIHVANTQYHGFKRLYSTAAKLADVDRRIVKAFEERESESFKSEADVVANQTVALTSALRVYMTYAQLQGSLGRIHSSVGVDLATDEEVEDLTVSELTKLIQGRRLELDSWSGRFPSKKNGA
ncbi:MAG: outer membrane protein TolC [Limisphaerales bacterium]|jgi:outer membrane protein TolC